MPLSDHDIITRFFGILAGGPGRGFLELRYRLDDERMGQVFERPRRAPALATRALALARGTDVYVGCAPRIRRKGGRDDIHQGFALWADCDGDKASDELNRFDPAPSIVIASGTGRNCHAYWPLSDPLPRQELERANRRLAAALGADPISADAARILRPPRTFSHKHSPAVAVGEVRFDPDTRFAAADVVAGLPELPPDPADDGPPTTRSRTDDPLLSIPPPVYVGRLLRVDVPRHGKVPCPFHADEQASLHAYRTADRGWFCFGKCRRGGTIYDLAAPLFGYGTRGEDFLRLRDELCRLFGITEA